MNIEFRLNGKNVQAEAEPDDLLLDLVRSLGCYSVKRGCETANCGLCTVWLDGKPVLSCSILAVRAEGAMSPLWKDFRRKQRNSACFWQRKAGSSADSAAPVSS